MNAAPRMTKPQHVYLDFVRASAAFCVLFGHASMAFLQGSALQKANIQIDAVPVFFLISGFLISLSVFQKHADPHYGFVQYFIERFCRIYSAYIPALLFTAIVDGLALQLGPQDWVERYNWRTWLGNLLMLQDFPLFQIARRLGVPDNPWFVSEFGSAGPFWTISIEWWIYMLFGMVAYYLSTHRPLGLWEKIVLGFVAIEPAYHFVGGPDRCLTMLWVLGMGASFLYFRQHTLIVRNPPDDKRERLIGFIVCGAGLMALVLHTFANGYHAREADIYGPTGTGLTEFQSAFYFAVALFALFFACGTFQPVPTFLSKTIGFFANYSYSLYLTHSAIIAYIQARYPHATYDLGLYWLAILASNVTAILFWAMFERYHHNIADKLKALIAVSEQPAMLVPTLPLVPSAQKPQTTSATRTRISP